jgi:5-enolpyruvylshikimate-3-phosphate synthase
VNHPAGSEYPESINVPHMKVMRDRVMASVLARTGHDITQFDGVIHATTMPAKDSDGNPVYDDHRVMMRNV